MRRLYSSGTVISESASLSECKLMVRIDRRKLGFSKIDEESLGLTDDCRLLFQRNKDRVQEGEPLPKESESLDSPGSRFVCWREDSRSRALLAFRDFLCRFRPLQTAMKTDKVTDVENAVAAKIKLKY